MGQEKHRPDRTRKVTILSALGAIGLATFVAVITPIGAKLTDAVWPDHPATPSTPTAAPSVSRPPAARPATPTPAPSFTVPTHTSVWPVPSPSGPADVLGVTTSRTDPEQDCPTMPGRVYPHRIEELASYGDAVNSRSRSIRDTWAAAHDGVDASYQVVSITVQNRTPRAVVLTGLEIRLTRQAPPLAGVSLRTFISGCGGQEVRGFIADLDRPQPSIAPLKQINPDASSTPVVTFPYRVTTTDPEVFQVVVYTLGCDCSWVGVLTWAADGENGSTVLLDGAQPFRVTSTSAAPAYRYQLTDGRIVRTEWGDFKAMAPFSAG